MKALEVINLKKTYTDKVAGLPVEALKGINLSIDKGSIFGLLGPNGAGKTTLIGAITTLEEPTSGDVRVFGESVIKDPLKTKMHTGVVLQEVVNTGFFSVEEILDFQSGYYGLYKNKEQCDYLMQKLSLYEHREKKVKQLSGGMKRRLMIAKALVHKPKLLLLDEPTAGVDVGLRESLWKFVHELKAEGISILLTTHYLEEAEKMCDHVAIIHKGQLLFNGTPENMISTYSHKKLILIMKSGETREYIESNRLGIAEMLAKYEIDIAEIHDLKIEEGRLEDAFSKMVGT
ncbi:MAG: ABC transporter ATP-binding protein [Bdellovibrionota bacterium]